MLIYTCHLMLVHLFEHSDSSLISESSAEESVSFSLAARLAAIYNPHDIIHSTLLFISFNLLFQNLLSLSLAFYTKHYWRHNSKQSKQMKKKEKKMPFDLMMLETCCSGCRSTSDLYSSSCKHMTLCFSCGKIMAQNHDKCSICHLPITRLIQVPLFISLNQSQFLFFCN